MVSQRDLNAVVEQVNNSYKVMADKISALEAQVALLSQNGANVKK